MDSLTARLMSRSGLNPVDPTLPPVHNMRIITLNPDMTDAEKNLHAARKALRTLEGANTDANKQALYRAMAALEGSEVQYFATRYIGKERPAILQGWKTHFTDKVDALVAAAATRVNNHRTSGTAGVRETVTRTDAIAKSLKDFDNFRTKPRQDQIYRRPVYKEAVDKMATAVYQIQNSHALAIAEAGITGPEEGAINDSLRDARQCLILMDLLKDNKRELPVSMIIPNP